MPYKTSFNPSELWIVCAISNPVRYSSRYNLYKNFEKHMIDSGVNLITVELNHFERDFCITDKNNKNHIQVYGGDSELWYKENLQVIGLTRLPPPDECKYVGLLDCDILFTNPNWATEAIEQLQHYKVVHGFSYAIDLDMNYSPLHTHTSFFKHYKENPKTFTKTGMCEDEKIINVNNAHPGFCCFYRRSVLDKISLIDFAILGAGDRHMAAGLIGEIEQTFYPKMTENFKLMLKLWQEKAIREVNYSIGYLPSTIMHFWHGSKKNRGYTTRSQILIDTKFDPLLDLYKNGYGLYLLHDHNVSLKSKIMEYFRSRNEDSIDF